MRVLACTILTIGMMLGVVSARAQTYDPLPGVPANLRH